MKNNEKLFLIVILMVAAAWLRMVNLGYSEFQGDEIRALFRAIEEKTASEAAADSP